MEMSSTLSQLPEFHFDQKMAQCPERPHVNPNFQHSGSLPLEALRASTDRTSKAAVLGKETIDCFLPLACPASHKILIDDMYLI